MCIIEYDDFFKDYYVCKMIIHLDDLTILGYCYTLFKIIYVQYAMVLFMMRKSKRCKCY